MAILAELHQEHVNMKRLLELLGRTVQKLHEGESDRPNFQLMSDVVNYVGNYADTHHHPREDRMFAYFKGRDAELDSAISRCEGEHHELKQLSTSLHDALDGVLNDAAVIPIDQLIDQLEQFVSRESQHLNLEEGDVFPKIEKVASSDDMAELDAQIPSPNDPLFGLKQADEYRDLYQALLEDNRSN